MKGEEPTGADVCPMCSGANECGMAKGDATCWCFALPHVLPLVGEKESRCYCRTCLTKVIRDRAGGIMREQGATLFVQGSLGQRERRA
jgi:hypothetical protein